MNRSVCFIGHKKINDTPKLRERLRSVLQKLAENGTGNFLFGDHSAFDDLCYELVTEFKEKHPAIKRIKYRTDYEEADDYTMQFLISGYEGNICPNGVGSAGRASYVERNRAMIDSSDCCVFYFDENYLPPRRKHRKSDVTDYQPKSGTAEAYRYAVQKKKEIVNLYEEEDRCPG